MSLRDTLRELWVPQGFQRESVRQIREGRRGNARALASMFEQPQPAKPVSGKQSEVTRKGSLVVERMLSDVMIKAASTDSLDNASSPTAGAVQLPVSADASAPSSSDTWVVQLHVRAWATWFWACIATVAAYGWRFEAGAGFSVAWLVSEYLKLVLRLTRVVMLHELTDKLGDMLRTVLAKHIVGYYQVDEDVPGSQVSSGPRHAPPKGGVAVMPAVDVTVQGKRDARLSLVNSVDTTWNLPLAAYENNPFPREGDNTEVSPVCLKNAHFLAMLCKGAYEEQAVFATLAQEKWSVDMVGEWRLASSCPSKPLIDSLAYVVSNDDAVVVVFRGTEPTSLIDWSTDLAFELVDSTEKRMGRIHSGFFAGAGLTAFGQAEHAHVCTRFRRRVGRGRSSSNVRRAKVDGLASRRRLNAAGVHAFDDSPDFLALLQLVLDAAEDKAFTRKVFITGYSLGGALAAVFAAAMAQAGFADLIAGVFTYGQPRTGDVEFVRTLGQLNEDGHVRVCRITHGVDPVPMLPPKATSTGPWHAYMHHPARMHLPATWGEPWHSVTGDTAAVSLQDAAFAGIHRLLAGLRHGESVLRIGLRLVGLAVPALGTLANDHLIVDYEAKLRLLVRAETANEQQRQLPPADSAVSVGLS